MRNGIFFKSIVFTNKGKPLLKTPRYSTTVHFVPRYCSTLQVADRGSFQQASWTPSTGHHGPLGVHRPPFEKP